MKCVERGRASRFRPVLLGAATLALALGSTFSLAVQPAHAAAAAKPAAGAYPKGPGSIAGLWFMTGYIGSTRPVQERIARDVNGQIPPLLPEAKAVLDKRVKEAEEGKIFANTAVYCLPQGVPYMLFGAVSGPLQILETPGQITMISEEFNELWISYMGRKFRSEDESDGPSFHGESVAHWDGDTLVIETIRLTDRTTLDQVGMPHSEEMKVTTRAKRISPTNLEFLVTIDDPKTFSKPWTRRVVYRKAPDTERIEDYACDNVRNFVDAEGYQSGDLKASPAN